MEEQEEEVQKAKKVTKMDDKGITNHVVFSN
jgi:hypothetical protein